MYKFSKVVSKLRDGVARKLKEKGREDLATDSDAREKEKINLGKYVYTCYYV